MNVRQTSKTSMASKPRGTCPPAKHCTDPSTNHLWRGGTAMGEKKEDKEYIEEKEGKRRKNF